MLAKWVFDTYEEGQFTQDQLGGAYETSGGAAQLESRLLPKSKANQLNAAAWELLGWIGPGDNFKQLKEEFVRLGGDSSDFDVFYETQGEWFYSDTLVIYEKAEAFMGMLQNASTNIGITRPSD